MASDKRRKPSFEFKNHVSPSYIEPLLLQLEPDQWYGSSDLKALLHASGLDVEGSDIVTHNASAWTLLGIVDSDYGSESRYRRYIRISDLGKHLSNVYSTNKELFFDLLHYLFYSAYLRSQSISYSRFWIYTKVCDELWTELPTTMDSFRLTNRFQHEAEILFSEYSPTFPERSVRSVFPWIAGLTPPFLEKSGSRGQFSSKRRSYCTPQLFHLSVDLEYTRRHFTYNTALSMDEALIESICRTCLLDTDRFWSMADLASMVIREFSTKRSQWGRSIILSGPPSWITLPDLARESEELDAEVDELDGADSDDEEKR